MRFTATFARKLSFSLLLAAFGTSFLFSQEPPNSLGITTTTRAGQSIGGDDHFSYPGSYTDLGVGLSYRSSTGFYGDIDLAARNDGRYTVADSALLGIPFYLIMQTGGIGYDGETFSGRAGRFVPEDVLDNPYSLFVSSRARPSLLYEFEYSGEWVRFLTRSVELNRNSALDHPDRSVTFQTTGFVRPTWEFGFQQAIVAVSLDGRSDGTGPLFVPEYFLNPFPNYLTQWTLGGGDTPWRQDINHKSLMGFYGRLELPGPDLGPAGEQSQWEFQGQWLVDDFAANLIWEREGDVNPFMMAWLASAALHTDWGRLRLTHAASHAYTFQTSAGRRYSYTWYPEVYYPVDGELRPLDYRDNYAGFYHGPNTAAIRLDWQHDLPADTIPATLPLDPLRLDAGLAYTASGEKSPLNPWGELESWRDHDTDGRDHTRWLDDDVLEHAIELDLSAAAELPITPRQRLGLSLGLDLSHRWNPITLTDSDRTASDDFPDDPQQAERYVPRPGETHTDLRGNISLQYSLSF